MPEEGVQLSPPSHLLTTPEIFHLSSVFVAEGVKKIRLTGGEPTVRPDIIPLMQSVGSLRSEGLQELCLTTNGISLHRKLDKMVEAGLTGVNLSIDTLDPFQYQIMTRRKGFEAVMNSINRILEMNRLGAGLKLKINCVVMRGINEREILDFVKLGQEKDIEVRFIEYMPFDGNKWSQGKMLPYAEMLKIIRAKYPELRMVEGHKNDTSKTFEVPGLAGKIGFITSMTHNFCGGCNRLRITCDGNLKVCLFGNSEVSLRDILRKENGSNSIDEAAYKSIQQVRHSADGQSSNELELLKVIGMAVQRKEAKHAGMGQLKYTKNRPMILIGDKRRKLDHRNRNPLQAEHKLQRPPWNTQPPFLWPAKPPHPSHLSIRPFSTSSPMSQTEKHLTHLKSDGSAHMVQIHHKPPTHRTAIARGLVIFSNATPLQLIRAGLMRKGDVLGVARIAGIMAAKKTSDLIPLCHPILLTGVTVDLTPFDVSHVGTGSHGGIAIEATIECEGQTGVEMEALTAVAVAALSVLDMCKGVDRGIRVEDVRVVAKRGGKSGDWEDDPR
ncbi:MAG: hypothetical protein M1829_003981 [Trizodia sp. TS-e1964]|nr:MAG: hypothetical protein M1829_003981 [Trizodia sp. TS-e1964]